MATYTELYDFISDDGFRNKVRVAVAVAAQAKLAAATPVAADVAWASAAISGDAETDKALRAVLAANKDLTVAQIQGATDAGLQTAVDNVVDGLILAYGA